MTQEMESDTKWATSLLRNLTIDESIWDFYIRGEDMSGNHEIIALILIARGDATRPLDKVIEKLQKQGLGEGAGIDSARKK
jgi:hypothetical protein